MNKPFSLDDKYTAQTGRVFMTGTQALVRLPITQMRLDRQAGLNTASFISGYRGSPIGGYDISLLAAKNILDKSNIVFQPGLNEDLAATAIWGSQQTHLSPQANKDGVLGIWYGKGPGVDRCGDVFKHGNAAGTSKHGGVLAIAGDDHTCKSSTIPHQSDHAFTSAVMPMLYPSSVHEFLRMGLLGIAMSRYSGCWVGYKVISETIETTSSVDLAQENSKIIIPQDFEMPQGGVNLRWPDEPLAQDERLQEHKVYAALAFARANKIDQTTINCKKPRIGIVASGKAYEDVIQALELLEIGQKEVEAIGLKLFKVRMPWPLEPHGIRHFSEGLKEVLIVEERREIIENQIKQQLYNWRLDVRPRIIGKFDDEDKPFLPLSSGLTVGKVAHAIAHRLTRYNLPEGLQSHIQKKIAELDLQKSIALGAKPSAVTRTPHYCAGCPHNISTKVPKGSKAMAGIGCHYMVRWMDRDTDTFTQMGGEGVTWSAISKFTDEKHRFVNLGDGTYFHSGLLAIRQSVAAGANITYKVLYNDAVAMTGGQQVDGELSPQQITHQLYHEGVKEIHLVSDRPDRYNSTDLAPGVIVKHRDHMEPVMEAIREVEGTTAIIYDQTCAAELRRRRKRKLIEDPKRRVFINEAVCEGCGDCSVQSNCIAIDPKETEFGRKREINQSACNKDMSCVNGFCPSFVTINGGGLKKPSKRGAADISHLKEPKLPALNDTWNIAVTGVGGTGILTVGALLGMAAHLENNTPMVMDMAGLAQKGGAVLSHIRISTLNNGSKAPRIPNGAANLLLAADNVVASADDTKILCQANITKGVVNSKLVPVSKFVFDRDFDFQNVTVEKSIEDALGNRDHFHNFSEIALALTGNEIAVNILMMGYAWQLGLIPIGRDALMQAIELNGVAVKANIEAFNWGRLLADNPEKLKQSIKPKALGKQQSKFSLDELIEHRAKHLANYQDENLAKKYRALIEDIDTSTKNILEKPEQTKLVRTTVLNYAKLLSYKDEYEVGRLYSTPEFLQHINDQFEGDFKLTFNLAPPFLSGKMPNGRPKKRKFGPATLKVFGLLAKMKKLRGTAFDVFGYSVERKAERALITQYEADIKFVISKLTKENLNVAIEILSLPDAIRGFGPVKMEAIKDYYTKRDALLHAFKSNTNALVKKRETEHSDSERENA